MLWSVVSDLTAQLVTVVANRALREMIFNILPMGY